MKPIILSILISAALYLLVRYWQKKAKKDAHKKEIDRLLDFDEADNYN